MRNLLSTTRLTEPVANNPETVELWTILANPVLTKKYTLQSTRLVCSNTLSQVPRKRKPVRTIPYWQTLKGN
jgi:hypothetical protein